MFGTETTIGNGSITVTCFFFLRHIQRHPVNDVEKNVKQRYVNISIKHVLFGVNIRGRICDYVVIFVNRQAPGYRSDRVTEWKFGGIPQKNRRQIIHTFS